MDMASAVIGAIRFAGGVAADWLRQWSASWMANREVRNAIRAEIHPVLVHLNFFILNAMDGDRHQDQTLIDRVWLSYWTLTSQAARTALLSGRRVSWIAGPHRSLRARARSCTMC